MTPGWTVAWTSTDGAHWEPLPGTTFWPGLVVVGIAEVPAGLVAVTELADPSYCTGGKPGCLPVMAWTSPDGRVWAPQQAPVFSAPRPFAAGTFLAAGPAGLLAVSSPAGPAGLLAPSSSGPALAATSPDGVRWTARAPGTIPRGFVVTSLVGTPTGYVLGGAVVTDTAQSVAATLWSADGRVWSPSGAMPTATVSGVRLASTGQQSIVTSVVVGSEGLIALGRFVATPGADIWWHSTDGRHWQVLPTYPPLGPTTCTGEGCGSQANGVLVGDGTRMVALRRGPDTRAWTSSDGLEWRRLKLTGDLPTDQATQAVLLPGGLLVSDGPMTWFGEAQGR